MAKAREEGFKAGASAVERALREALGKAQVIVQGSDRICGVVLPYACPDGAPVACAWKWDHLPEKPHSWASLPTVVVGQTTAG